MSIKKIALITGLTISGLVGSGNLTPANAAKFFVDGRQYEITTFKGSSNANSVLLRSQRFFGSQTSAVNFATVVGNFFGPVNNIPVAGSNPSGASGPLFAFAFVGGEVATARFDIAPTGTVVTQNLSGTNTNRVYALATSIPEHSGLFSTIAAVGLAVSFKGKLTNNK